MKPDANLVNEIIRSRRSIFPAQYTKEIIEDSIIEEILENANWAPTHKLTEPWRFNVFTGHGIQKLAVFQANLYRDLTQRDESFKEEKFERLKAKPLLCSHIISIGMKRHDRIPEIEEISAVACAVQNMYLTATAHGLGCYWGTGGITYFKEAKEFFGLGTEDKLMGFFFLGKTEKNINKGIRKSIVGKVKWIR